MKLLMSFSECRWITEGVLQKSPDTKCTVAHCVPPIFPHYVKIFHPIYEDLSIQDEELTWQEDERKKPAVPNTAVNQRIQDLIARSTLVYGGAEPGSRPVRIRWAQLARRLGMPFVPTLSSASFTRAFQGGSWPRHLIGPQEGNLASVERDALASVLHRHTETDRILFHFWLLATIQCKGDMIFEGTLEEASLFPDNAWGVRTTPTHWFPEDRSWLVCTDYDLTFTLVGGSERLVHDLLNDEILECGPVQPGTRVDWEADLERSIQ